MHFAGLLGPAALSLVQSGNNPQVLVDVLVRRGQTLHTRLMDAHRILRGAKYPYEHMESGATISRYCLELVPPSSQIVELYRAAEATLDGVYKLYIRLMSDLAARAEAMETAVGLDPLPKPESKLAASKDS